MNIIFMYNGNVVGDGNANSEYRGGHLPLKGDYVTVLDNLHRLTYRVLAREWRQKRYDVDDVDIIIHLERETILG